MLIEYLIAAALALMGLTGALVLTQDVSAMYSATYHLVIADNLLGEIEAQYLMSGEPLQALTAPCGNAADPPQKFATIWRPACCACRRLASRCLP